MPHVAFSTRASRPRKLQEIPVRQPPAGCFNLLFSCFSGSFLCLLAVLLFRRAPEAKLNTGANVVAMISGVLTSESSWGFVGSLKWSESFRRCGGCVAVAQ